MSSVFSGLFGGKPKTLKLVTQPEPIEKIMQSNIADDAVRKELAKRQRATMLSQLSQANIKRQTLGAG